MSPNHEGLVGYTPMPKQLAFVQDAPEGSPVEQRDRVDDAEEAVDRFRFATYRMIGRARDLTQRSQLPLGAAWAALCSERMLLVANVVQLVGGGRDRVLGGRPGWLRRIRQELTMLATAADHGLAC